MARFPKTAGRPVDGRTLRRKPDTSGHRPLDFHDRYPRCRACGSQWNLRDHHVVYRQHVERAKGDRWHPDNALRLCQNCHEIEQHARRAVPLTRLRDENLAFAFALYGPYAADYLRRRYAGDDPRLAAYQV